LNSKGNIGGATVLYFFVGGSTPLAGNLVKSGSKYRVNLTYYAGPQIVTATSLMTRQT
jgi:hypothetical protein